MWKTGPIAGSHRAIMQNNTLVAIAESPAQAELIVRTMNGAQGPDVEHLRSVVTHVIAEMRSPIGFIYESVIRELEEALDADQS